MAGVCGFWWAPAAPTTFPARILPPSVRDFPPPPARQGRLDRRRCPGFRTLRSCSPPWAGPDAGASEGLRTGLRNFRRLSPTHPRRKLRPGVEVQLAQDAVDVGFDGADRQEQPAGDLP